MSIEETVFSQQTNLFKVIAVDVLEDMLVLGCQHVNLVLSLLQQVFKMEDTLFTGLRLTVLFYFYWQAVVVVDDDQS